MIFLNTYFCGRIQQVIESVAFNESVEYVFHWRNLNIKLNLDMGTCARAHTRTQIFWLQLFKKIVHNWDWYQHIYENQSHIFSFSPLLKTNWKKLPSYMSVQVPPEGVILVVCTEISVWYPEVLKGLNKYQ